MEIGFLGFGEAAFYFISGLINEKEVEIWVYDIDYNKAVKQKEVLQCSELVKVTDNLADVIRYCKIIFVAVPGSVDEQAFNKLLKHTEDGGKVFVDLCTVLPDVKNKISLMVEEAGNYYIDAAVMGSVPRMHHRVPILVSGTDTGILDKLSEEYCMNITRVGKKAGDASVIKLCRSIYMKGIAALLIETKQVADIYNVSDEVFDSLAETMNSDAFEIYSRRLVEGTYQHCERRKKEVEDCIELIRNAGLTGPMTEATEKVYAEIISRKEVDLVEE